MNMGMMVYHYKKDQPKENYLNCVFVCQAMSIAGKGT